MKQMFVGVGVLALVVSAAPGQTVLLPKPKPNSAEEPLAAQVSLTRAAEFLDAASVNWTNDRKCGTCHTNYPYLMARPALKETALAGHDQVRKFFESRIEGWETEKGKPRWDTEVVATAATLAFNDAHTTGKLHPLTRKALDKMWTLQQKDGAWNWLKCRWPPFEHDDYYGAVFVAVCVGSAPDNYAAGPSAGAGLARLRGYLQKTPPPAIHHQAWLMWASLKLDGLMTAEQRAQTIKDLLALERADGGWNLPSLGEWKPNQADHVNDKNGPSDGYGTGFVVYVLRQAGLPADHQAIQKGLKWLHTNQRETGRWFTRSLNTERYHFVSNAGTAFAVMALKACE